MLDGYLTIATHPLVIAAIASVVVFFFLLQTIPEAGITIRPLRFHKKSGLNALGWFAVLLFPVWLALLGPTLAALYGLWSAPPDPTDAETLVASRLHYLAIVGLMTALAGLVGTPLALIRVFTTERTTTATEEGLITDRINKAVEGLGAEKTVVEVVTTPQYKTGDDGKAIPVTLPDGTQLETRETRQKTAPNLEVRIGAIYALERIAQDSLRDHIQIMEILCAYIRENSHATPPQDFPEPEWVSPTGYTATENQLEQQRSRFGSSSTMSKAWKWAEALPKPRADIQVGLEVVGRRHIVQRDHEKTNRFRLDLKGTNLQGCDISEKYFDDANLSDARLEGAVLNTTWLNGASLQRTQLEGASLKGATLKKSNLTNAALEGANLEAANLEAAIIWGTSLDGANLVRTNLDGACLWEASIDRTALHGASLRGASLRRIRFGSLQHESAFHSAFGDRTVGLPKPLFPGAPPPRSLGR